jgi:CBS-domain-containing membrane protein
LPADTGAALSEIKWPALNGGRFAPDQYARRLCWLRTLPPQRAVEAGQMPQPMYRFLELTVEQYMTHAVQTVGCCTRLRELDGLFRRHDFNAFPVVEAGRLVGVVTKFDFLKAFAFTTRELVPRYDELMQRCVREVMTERVVHVEPHVPLTRVLQMMVDLRSRSFPVVAGGRSLAGIIAREDIMRALQDATCRPLLERVT